MEENAASEQDETVSRKQVPESDDSGKGTGVSDDSAVKDGVTQESDASESVSQRTHTNVFEDAGLAPGLEEAKTVIRQKGDSGAKPAGRPGRTPAEIAKVLVGEQLNQYFLEALIGGGGMGAVFRAHDQQLDRIVALKVIPFVGNDPELQRRFRNEAQNAAKLDHPKIARVFDAGNYDDWHYIVFEYIDGTNLRDLVTDHGVLSLDDAVVFTSQVAEALDHAAQRGIVHRDIKPSNVLVADAGSVKLVDMGLARSDNLDLSEDMTASGVTLGTFDYISPEQAFDPRDADLRSDLYSLGCTFYFMVTGEAPYTGGTMLQKLISHGNAPLPDPRKLRPDLPDEAIAIMHRMMAKDPNARYQNAKDLLADLQELAYRFQLKRALANDVVAVPSGNDGLQRLQTHLPWMIAALLVLMVGGYLELQSTATRDSFVIEGPSAVSRSVMDPTSSGAQGTDAEILQGAGSGSTATSPGDSDGVSRSGGDEGEFSVGESSLGSEVGSNTQPDDEDLGADAIARAAALPPRFSARLPIPDGMGDFATGSDSISGLPLGAPMALDEIGFLSGADGMVFLPEAASGFGSDNSTSDASLSATRPREAGSLPSPRAIRVVAPSLLALSPRVDQVNRDTDGAVLASTLEDAIDLAMRFGVERVELATPRIVSGPVAIPLDNMIFESTVGRTMIEMRSPDNLVIGRTEMVNIGNNRTQFRNLDFQWEVAQEQVDGGAMFVVNDNRLSRFFRCTFTLVNQSIHDGVSVFQVVTDPESLPDSETLPGRVLNPNENALPFVAIQLDDAIVRGEGDFIRMDYAAALQLVWNNGLLAVSGRMIDTSGALRRPELVASPIQISLTNVTADLPRGLLRMRLGPTGIFPVPIERDANQCVFLVDDGQPEFELIGVETLTSERPSLKIRGEGNAYVGTLVQSVPMLFASDLEGNSSLSLLEEMPLEKLPWMDERRPTWSVRWSSLRPANQTFHRLTPADYAQDGAIYFGFREAELPPLP